MLPVVLHTERLVLDQPTEDDIDDVFAYCQDPLFERYLTVPWPYRRADAEYFVRDFVPEGWAADRECTWAVRRAGADGLLGVVGLRTARSDLGYWLGAPFRGHGYMPEAVRAVVDFAFDSGHEEVRWECLIGNAASAAVARKVGFSYAGEAPSSAPYRGGGHPASWHGVLRSPHAATAAEPALPWPVP